MGGVFEGGWGGGGGGGGVGGGIDTPLLIRLYGVVKLINTLILETQNEECLAYLC